MIRILAVILILLAIGAILHQATYSPTPEEIKYQEAVKARDDAHLRQVHAENQQLTNELWERVKGFSNARPTPYLTPTPIPVNNN